jgi:30S ribosomal protein S31
MGKGDKKSRKGKIVMGTYGNSRPGAKNPKAKKEEVKKEEVPAKED